VVGAPLLLVIFLIPSVAAVAVARRAAARALGLRGVGWLLDGRVDRDTPGFFWRSALVALFGLLASYLFPVVFFVAAMLAGVNAEWSTEVRVAPDKPAEAAGMKTGDRVVSVGGTRVATFADLAAQIGPRAGEPVEVVVLRGSEEVRFSVTPEGPPGKARIGVAPKGKLARGFLSSVAMGITEPFPALVRVARGFVQMATGTTSEELAGPVGIVRESSRAGPSGLGELLYYFGLMMTMVWPFASIAAVVTAPRRARRDT
jgi:regulator of sigma E protease